MATVTKEQKKRNLSSSHVDDGNDYLASTKPFGGKYKCHPWNISVLVLPVRTFRELKIIFANRNEPKQAALGKRGKFSYF